LVYNKVVLIFFSLPSTSYGFDYPIGFPLPDIEFGIGILDACCVHPYWIPYTVDEFFFAYILCHILPVEFVVSIIRNSVLGITPVLAWVSPFCEVEGK
jgi:hypothetical protein